MGYYFILFYCITSDCAQDLLTILCSEIIPSGVQGIIYGAGIKPRSAACKVKAYPLYCFSGSHIQVGHM